jgi:hypothetical protein
MAVNLPPGWAINEVLEIVPSPNVGTPMFSTFARITYVCTDQHGDYVCSSGSREDCESQAHAMAEAWSQQIPYDTER